MGRKLVLNAYSDVSEKYEDAEIAADLVKHLGFPDGDAAAIVAEFRDVTSADAGPDDLADTSGARPLPRRRPSALGQ